MVVHNAKDLVNQTNPLLTLLKKQVIAHRGSPKLTPENTLKSFTMAATQNAQWVEFDTQPCVTGEWVVIHDESLERTTNGQGLVAKTSWQSLKTLDAGAWFDPHFRGERLPLLSEVLTLVQRLGLHPNIEIKHNNPLKIQQNLKTFTTLLEEYWPTALLPPLVSSFDVEILAWLKKHTPELPRGLLTDHIESDIFQQIERIRPFSLHCNVQHLSKDRMTELLNKDFAFLLYTINDSQLAKIYFEMGVDAIFSDIPNLISQS